MKAEKTEELSVITFRNGKAKKIATTVCSLELVLRDGTCPEISGPIHQRTPVDVGKIKPCWKNLPLADSLLTKNEKMTIYLLIGSDY